MNESSTIRLRAMLQQGAVWTLVEEIYAEGRLAAQNARDFSSRAALESELAKLYLSNLDMQRLLDGEAITLWQ